MELTFPDKAPDRLKNLPTEIGLTNRPRSAFANLFFASSSERGDGDDLECRGLDHPDPRDLEAGHPR
jgi:hypothetical protein